MGKDSTEPKAAPEDVLNILLATDIHLGYAEKDAIRGEDSFNSFEEILSLAVKHEVDLILLGGDLFHDNKPTMNCIHKCMTLIRKYCLGDKPISVEFMSDQSQNFSHCVNPTVNYEDPNLNISIPIFSIHGNHDDPSGFGRTCTLDLLSATGLINYFGKCDDLSEIKISPLLMSKGITQLAIYGLSYIKDERLSRLFRDRKVHMYKQSNAADEDWFNIFVLHQNRADRGPNNYLSEDVLPEFLDLVFWGHEHECRVRGEYNARRNFYVTQPGSPVATSLSEGEAVEKHVGLLRVYQKGHKLEPIKLETVRPFIFDTITLSGCTLPDDDDNPSDNVQAYVNDYLETMFEKVDRLLTGHPKQPTLPLLRLRVEYSDESQMFNPIRFGQMKSDRVANPQDMILLRREKKDTGGAKGSGVDKLDREAMDAVLKMEDPQALWETRVERVVEKYFLEVATEQQKLRVLSVKGLSEGVIQFIDKEDKEAIADVANIQIEKTSKKLLDDQVTEDNIFDKLSELRDLREERADEEADEVRNALADDARQAGRKATRDQDDDDVIDVDSDEEDMAPSKPARGRGRGRAAATTRGTRGGRGAAKATRGKKEVVGQLTLADSFSAARRPPTARNGSGRGSLRKGASFPDSDSD